MLGILVLIAVFIVLGFLYAWIAGVVAKEEVEVKTGVMILILAGVLTVVLNLALSSLDPVLHIVLTSLGQLAIIALLTNLITGIKFAQSLLIAFIYAVILTIIGFVIGAIAGA